VCSWRGPPSGLGTQGARPEMDDAAKLVSLLGVWLYHQTARSAAE
jgi:hypothetical protein